LRIFKTSSRRFLKPQKSIFRADGIGIGIAIAAANLSSYNAYWITELNNEISALKS
jgi:hypothetical protein